jgi:hypothetical protein
VVIGRIGPKHTEAIPARVGLQFDGRPTFDPAEARYGIMQEVRCIDKIDFWPLSTSTVVNGFVPGLRLTICLKAIDNFGGKQDC